MRGNGTTASAARLTPRGWWITGDLVAAALQRHELRLRLREYDTTQDSLSQNRNMRKTWAASCRARRTAVRVTTTQLLPLTSSLLEQAQTGLGTAAERCGDDRNTRRASLAQPLNRT